MVSMKVISLTVLILGATALPQEKPKQKSTSNVSGCEGPAAKGTNCTNVEWQDGRINWYVNIPFLSPDP